jgi:hypothetical protein
MTINLFFVPLLFVCTTSFAAWKEQRVLLDVTNVTQPSKIAKTLRWVKSFQDDLVSLDLASPSKLVVKSISARVSYFKWSNDSTCTTPDPEIVALQRQERVSANYYYADLPNDIRNIFSANGLPSPCN